MNAALPPFPARVGRFARGQASRGQTRNKGASRPVGAADPRRPDTILKPPLADQSVSLIGFFFFLVSAALLPGFEADAGRSAASRASSSAARASVRLAAQ